MTLEALDRLRAHGAHVVLTGTWYWATFQDKPSEAIRDELKDMGFHWASAKKKWVLPGLGGGNHKTRRWSWDRIRSTSGEEEN